MIISDYTEGTNHDDEMAKNKFNSSPFSSGSNCFYLFENKNENPDLETELFLMESTCDLVTCSMHV